MLRFFILLTIITKTFATFDDEYLTEKQKQCKLTKKPMDCFKYRVVKYVSEYGSKDFLKARSQFGPFRLVKIEENSLDGLNETVKVLGEVRQFDSDTEFDKVLKFLKRWVNNILQSYAIKVPLPNDGQNIIVMEDDEDENGNRDVATNEIDRDSHGESRGRGIHKKKKLQILFPLLVMLKLFKVKVLLVIILFGVLFIKKAIIGAGLVIPSLLNSLKMCKQMHHGLHVDHGFAADYAGDYGSYSAGYNLAGGPYAAAGGIPGNGIGAKDYSGVYDRVYNSYKP